MRKLLILLIVPLFFSCGETKQERELREKNDSLMALLDQDDATIQKFVTAFNEIQDNLNQIKEQENMITVTAEGNDMDQQMKDQINDDILSIYQKMVDNRDKMKKMERMLNSSTYKNSELNQMYKNLKKQLEERDVELNKLKNRLAEMNITIESLNEDIAGLTANVDTLSQQNQEKSKIIEEKTTALNTAYYVVGTKKELKEQEIITREGGFIGIGGMQKLMDDFNKDYFKKIDLTKVDAIPIMSKKAEIITTHPSAYRFTESDNGVDSLIITNKKEFWSVSKYLVIMVNN